MHDYRSKRPECPGYGELTEVQTPQCTIGCTDAPAATLRNPNDAVGHEMRPVVSTRESIGPL